MKILFGERVGYNTNLVANIQIVVGTIWISRPSISISDNIAHVSTLGDLVLPNTRRSFNRFGISDYSAPFRHFELSP
jgi:hypothetical protein